MALALQLDAISQGPKKFQFPWPNFFPLALVMDLCASETLHTAPFKS
jgi:hypothetical protein